MVPGTELAKPIEAKIAEIRSGLVDSLGGHKIYQETLKHYKKYAKPGDNAYGVAIWSVIYKIEPNYEHVQEEMYQTFIHREFQRKLSNILGLTTDWQKLNSGNQGELNRLPSELLEAVIGRLLINSNFKEVPVKFIESLFELLSDGDKKPARSPQERFERNYPGYHIEVGDAGLNENGKSLTKASVKGTNGEIVSSYTSRREAKAIMAAIKSAERILNA